MRVSLWSPQGGTSAKRNGNPNVFLRTRWGHPLVRSAIKNKKTRAGLHSGTAANFHVFPQGSRCNLHEYAPSDFIFRIRPGLPQGASPSKANGFIQFRRGHPEGEPKEIDICLVFFCFAEVSPREPPAKPNDAIDASLSLAMVSLEIR